MTQLMLPWQRLKVRGLKKWLFFKNIFSILTTEMESTSIIQSLYQFLPYFIHKLLRYSLLKQSAFRRKHLNFNMTTSWSMTSVEIWEFCLVWGIYFTWATPVQNFIMIRPLTMEIYVLIINVKPKWFTIRIKRDPPSSFLDWRIQCTSGRKNKPKPLNTEVCTVHHSSNCSNDKYLLVKLVQKPKITMQV